MRPVLQSFVRTSGLLDLYQFHSPFKLYSLRWFRNKRRRHSKQLKKLVPPIRIERTTNGLGMRCHHPTPAYSGSLRPSLAKSYEKIDFGLPLILWTSSRHNCRREVPHGPTATEFHAGV